MVSERYFGEEVFGFYEFFEFFGFGQRFIYEGKPTFEPSGIVTSSYRTFESAPRTFYNAHTALLAYRMLTGCRHALLRPSSGVFARVSLETDRTLHHIYIDGRYF